MIQININGKELKGYPGQTILELAKLNDISIPTLCHDDRVKPYGACGICVVEHEGRLIRACASEISAGMIINTETEKVKNSRKLTLELLLSDHRGDCRPPCVRACPADTDCQGYVTMIANGQYKEAYNLIKESIVLPASIGIVCPHPCEDACRRQLPDEAISIAALKAFVGEKVLAADDVDLLSKKDKSGKRIAVIGSGPAGLAAAYDLCIEGHEVLIYEAMPEAGGMLKYGIPQYRLPKDLLDKEIKLVEDLGVKFIYNTRINQDISLEYLRNEYDAVFIGIGAWKSSKISCPGEELEGVWGGIDFLREVVMNGKFSIGERVVVIGGGNTAMDAARTAVRCGAEVIIAYRRTREEMPAEAIEIQEADEEGVIFKFLRSPIEICGQDGKVSQMRLQVMELGEADSSGRRRPVAIKGQEDLIEVDTIIAAIGQDVDCPFDELELNKWDNIIVAGDSMMTNLAGVFAGGDVVTGPGIAIEAMAQGKKAAKSINAYLDGQVYETSHSQNYIGVNRDDLSQDDFSDIEKKARVSFHHALPMERNKDFRRVSRPFSDEEARLEANRCLECGCKDYFECKLISYANEYQLEFERWSDKKEWEIAKDKHPFLERDHGKCILCGLCVRVCDEVMGVTALGLVKRGFEATVKPEFGLALEDSSCISCGQCAALCPTGAIMEKYPLVKNLPVKMSEETSTCSFCSLNCQIKVHTCGDKVLRIQPADEHVLCKKGRFSFEVYEENRISSPLVKRNGMHVAVSWQEAMQLISLQTSALKGRYGSEALLVTASPSLSTEVLSVLEEFSYQGLKTCNLASFSNSDLLMDENIDDNNFHNSLEEIEASNLLFILGPFAESQIAMVKARKAAQNNAELILINQSGNLLSDIAKLEVHPANNVEFLLEIMAAIINENLYNGQIIAEKSELFEEIKAKVKDIKASAEARKMASSYAKAKKAMIIIDESEVSNEAVQILRQMASITGHIASPRDGIIIVYRGANALALRKTGFIKNTQQVLASESSHIKALYIWGEDPVGESILKNSDLDKLEYLVVASTHLSPTAKLADVILPLASPLESSGTYLRCDNKVQVLNAVKKPFAMKSNIAIIEELNSRLIDKKLLKAVKK